MKKRALMFMLAVAGSVMLAAGCGDKDKDADAEETTETVAEAETEIAIETEEPTYEEPVYEEPSEVYDFSVEEPVEEVEVETDEYGITTIDEIKLYATEAVRIRREPNTDSDIAGKLAAGDEVTATGKSDEWHRIVRNGETLYVKSEYLTETKPETTAESEDNAESTDTASTDSTAAEDTSAATDTSAADAAAAQAAAEQAAADQAAAEKAATDAAAAIAASALATYDVNGLKVNATEYKALLDTWRWATANGTDEEALEYVLHHPAGDLEAVLRSKGLR